MTEGDKTGGGGEAKASKNSSSSKGAEHVLYAETPNSNMVIGIVCDSEPSSLTLLAAGSGTGLWRDWVPRPGRN